MPKKVDTSLDEYNYRKFCSDGHPLIWPIGQLFGRYKDQPHAREWSNPAIGWCTEGHFWKQTLVRIRRNGQRVVSGRLKEIFQRHLRRGGRQILLSIDVRGPEDIQVRGRLVCTGHHSTQWTENPPQSVVEVRERLAALQDQGWKFDKDAPCVFCPECLAEIARAEVQLEAAKHAEQQGS